MTKITQNSILTSFTATNRFILRKCNPKLLNVNNTPVKTIFDSSWETRLKELSATNFNYHPNKRNLAPPLPCVAQLSNIATYDGTNWNLNGNPTIVTGCLLTIPLGTTLVIGSGLTLTNNGTITQSGTITNSLGGTLTNTGYISNYGTITNTSGGNIYNSGTIFNQNGSFITNNLGGTITNQASGTITNDNDFTNNGTIDNYGFIQNYAGGTVSFSNNYLINNKPLGRITNQGGEIFNNNSGGTINNYGILTNLSSYFTNYAGGTITNQAGGIITNYASGVAVINNNGSINNSLGGTIYIGDGINCGTGNITNAPSGTAPLNQCQPP